MQPDWHDFPMTDPAAPSRGKRFVMGCLSLLLVAALLLSAASGAVWLLRQRRAAAVAAPTPPPATRPAAADAASAAAAEAAATSPAARAAAVSPPASSETPVNRIVYVDRDGQLSTIAPDGSDGRQLTETDLRFQFPAWSPDGQRLAAIGGGRSGSGIYVLRDETGQAAPEPRYFSRTENPFYLYWAPDSSQISFLANYSEDGIGLFLTPADGQIESRVLATGSPFYWHWTRDGKILFHTGATSGDARVALLDAAGEAEEEAIASPGLFQSPAISADGRIFAFATERADGLSWLLVQEANGRVLFEQPHPGSAAFGWNPARNLLAVINGRSESTLFYGPLRLLDAESGAISLLSSATVLCFFWSPDGQYLAYMSTEALREDVQAALPPAQLAEAPRGGRQARIRPVAQPNGVQISLRVVDVATGDDRLLLRFQPSFPFLSQLLPFFDQYAHSHSLWSPDSRALVLPVRREGGSSIVVVPVSGAEPQRIAAGDMPFWSQQ